MALRAFSDFVIRFISNFGTDMSLPGLTRQSFKADYLVVRNEVSCEPDNDTFLANNHQAMDAWLFERKTKFSGRCCFG